MAFILASTSPRRLDLLQQIGRRPDSVIPSDIDESQLVNEPPKALAERLALAKAQVVAEDHPEDVILAADTVVACGSRVLPKPSNEDEARRYLELLSGRRHRVYGGVAVISPRGTWSRCVMTQVSFKRLSKGELDSYIHSGEWQGKAGSYAIQGRAGAFVKQINGSYSNVVGLCLYTIEPVLAGLLGPVTHGGD